MGGAGARRLSQAERSGGLDHWSSLDHLEQTGLMDLDPVTTNPDHYKVDFENDVCGYWSTRTSQETGRLRTSIRTA